jgi:hypothetical protein
LSTNKQHSLSIEAIVADYKTETIAADCKYAKIEPIAKLQMLACHAAAIEPAAGPAAVNPKTHTTG